MPAWTWSWHPHPETWALIVVLLGGYRLALSRLAPPGEGATRAQRRNFTLGALAILVAVEWPIHDLAEGYLYSVHMFQHLILTLVVPPLLLSGTPAWLFRSIVRPPVLRVVRHACRPFAALAVFNVVIVFTHWPLMVNSAAGSEPLHFGVHVVLVAAAMVMWMPVLSPVLEIPRLSFPGQMMYLFLQSLVPTVPASFLTFGDRPLYAAYVEAVRPWGISALGDQRTAGLIMKLAGGAVLWGFITAIFFRWSSLEQNEGVDALEHRDVERSLNRTELVDR